MQGLPSIRVIQDGQLVDQMEGPQGERALRAMLDRLTMTSGELLREQLDGVLAAGDYAAALAMLKQALAAEPNNPAFKLEYADVLVLSGDLDQARTVLATVPEGTEGRDRPLTRLQMMEEAAGMGEIDRNRCRRSPRTRMTSSCAIARRSVQAVHDNYEVALDHAMHILQKDRKFRDDIGRADAGADLRAAAERLRTGEKLSAPHVRADALIDR